MTAQTATVQGPIADTARGVLPASRAVAPGTRGVLR
jgi:hypothetical protein